jgi:hypothetical protein
VEYPPEYEFGPWVGRFQDLEDELTALLGRDVNVSIMSVLRNERFRREAEKTRTVIYDAVEFTDVA